MAQSTPARHILTALLLFVEVLLDAVVAEATWISDLSVVVAGTLTTAKCSAGSVHPLQDGPGTPHVTNATLTVETTGDSIGETTVADLIGWIASASVSVSVTLIAHGEIKCQSEWILAPWTIRCQVVRLDL